MWDYQALNQTITWGATMDEFSPFYKALNPSYIGIGTVALKWLIPRLHDFERRFPDMKVRLSTSYFDWDFDGDGTYDYTTNLSASVGHVYALPGVYHVSFRVRDWIGQSATASTYVFVGPVGERDAEQRTEHRGKEAEHQRFERQHAEDVAPSRSDRAECGQPLRARAHRRRDRAVGDEDRGEQGQ